MWIDGLEFPGIRHRIMATKHIYVCKCGWGRSSNGNDVRNMIRLRFHAQNCPQAKEEWDG